MRQGLSQVFMSNPILAATATAMRLVQLAPPEPQPEYNRWTEVVILDRLPTMAVVRLGGDTGLGTRKWGGEYDHLVVWNGTWVILHVHWGLYMNDPVDDGQEDATIESTALDYIESLYDADAARIERTLHPHLVRRTVMPNGASLSHLIPGDFLHHMSAYGLLQFVAERGVPTARSARRGDVTILDRLANTASVRIDASTWVEYLTIGKWNGRWLIVNSLWTQRQAE